MASLQKTTCVILANSWNERSES